MRTETRAKADSKKPSAKLESAGEAKHDVIVLLKQDHMAVKKLFRQYETLAKQADSTAKIEIAQQICAELIAHTLVEEEIFYPAALQATQDSGMFNEAKVEHDSAKDLIAQIQRMDPQDEMYDAKVKVLGEYITHHVQEEENEMFPKVRESGQVDLKALATTLQQRKQALMQELCDSSGKVLPQRLMSKLGLSPAH